VGSDESGDCSSGGGSDSSSEINAGGDSGGDSDSGHERGGHDDDAGDAPSSDDEEELPLHQRLSKNEGRGSKQRVSRRERRSKALEEATKRLASFKNNKTKRTNKTTDKNNGATSGGDEAPVSSSNNNNDDDKDDNENNDNNKNAGGAAAKKKKKNKHKPTEVSSKRKDFYARGARRLNESGLGVDIGAHRYKPMDPRASNLSGHFDEDRFHNNYAFLEEVRNREIGQVRKRIAAHKATGNKGNRLRKKLQIVNPDGSHSSTLEEDVARLKSLTETRANLERRKIDRAAKQSVKRKIREDVESGKTGAYFLKRKEKKRLELEARFEEIRKRGGEKAVEKILAKKRQKNKSRDAGAFAK